MGIDIAKIVGRNIRAFREWRGLSQEELGEKSSLHRVYIGTIERGQGNITLENLYKISAALKVELHLLLIEGANDWIRK